MMSEIWPFDVKQRLAFSPMESVRPFKCLLLMPFEARFNRVSEIVGSTVKSVFDGLRGDFQLPLPRVERLDWVDSAGVIHDQLWRRVAGADLIFCDLTGYNPNVMFEAGVCAAWLPLRRVVFIRDHYFTSQSPFDLAPIRYLEYSLTSDGVPVFVEKLKSVVLEAVVAFPDDLGDAPSIALPLEIDFRGNHDDLRLWTPPLAHRRVVGEMLEFGSQNNFAHSWLSVGKARFSTFEVEIEVKFCQSPRPEAIHLGIRSQHYFANYAHILYLRADGKIVLTQPDESNPKSYEDLTLRESTAINLDSIHTMRASFTPDILRVDVDDFSREFKVAEMPKVLSPGFIRIQSFRGWTALRRISVREI